MNSTAKALLSKLLAQVDRGGRDSLLINERSAKQYFSIQDITGRDSLHASLENIAELGAIKLEWGNGAASQDLKRIRMRDACLLAELLGVSRALSKVVRIEQGLSMLMDDAPDWLRTAYEDALDKWRLGKTAFRTSADEASIAIQLFQIAYAVSRGEQEKLDLRRFSVSLLNDSKAVESVLLRLANLLRCNPEWSEFEENEELFRYLGLEKFPPTIQLRGPVKAEYSGKIIDVTDFRPYIGLAPDQVNSLSLTRPPPYLLTIENLASFQRHVREIEDDGIIIYSAGFPATALTRLLKALSKIIDPECRCYHWGDRDIGGIRIYHNMASIFRGHKFAPHLMNVGGATDRVFSEKELQVLERYVDKEASVGAMAKYWLENNLGPMEQEAVDPCAPDLE